MNQEAIRQSSMITQFTCYMYDRYQNIVYKLICIKYHIWHWTSINIRVEYICFMLLIPTDHIFKKTCSVYNN